MSACSYAFFSFCNQMSMDLGNESGESGDTIPISTRQISIVSPNFRAMIMKSSLPLSQRVDKADVIVVAQVMSCTLNKRASNSLQKDEDQTLPRALNAQEILKAFELQESGDYTFKVQKYIKGQCEPTIQMHLNALNCRYYGYGKTRISEGSQVILFLKPLANKNYEAVDPLIPLTPISSNAFILLDEDQKADFYQQVYNMLLASLSDVPFRRSSISQLRTVEDTDVATIVANYSDDDDIEVKDSALYCMMVNQRVEFIPKVLKLSEELGKTNQSPECLQAFRYLKVPEATPYLNNMLFSEYYYIRLHATFALDPLADESSIPYLMVALSDPDPQNIIAYSAYHMIYRSAPDLKKPKSEEYFYANREKEIDIVYRWWKGYLSGENALKGRKRGLLSDSDLSSSLYSLDVDDRKKAIKSLSIPLKLADVPYVMVSLSDPDEEVAFNSYVLLKSIINTLPDIKSANDFGKESERVMRDSRSWWMQKLKDRLEE